MLNKEEKESATEAAETSIADITARIEKLRGSTDQLKTTVEKVTKELGEAEKDLEKMESERAKEAEEFTSPSKPGLSTLPILLLFGILTQMLETRWIFRFRFQEETGAGSCPNFPEYVKGQEIRDQGHESGVAKQKRPFGFEDGGLLQS